MPLPDLTALSGPIGRATARTSVVLGLRLLVQTSTLLLVARLLGPQQFGAFAGAAALAVVLGTLSTFGMHFVLLEEVSRDPAQRHEVLRYAVPTTLLLGSVLLVTYLLISPLVLAGAGIGLLALVAIGGTEMVLQPLFGLPTTEHWARGRVARSQLLTILPLAVRLLAACTVFLSHPADPLKSYVYGYFFASLTALFIATLSMPAPWPALRCWRLPSRGELRHAGGYAALAITGIGPAELDKTLATNLLPLATAGLYAAGARIIGAATLPVIAMMLSALPRLFQEGQHQPQRTAHLLRFLFICALAYSVGLAALLWSFAPVFLWLFGPNYRGLPHIIHWLCLAIPGMALRMAAGSVLMALGRPWIRVGFELTGLVILVVTAMIFIKFLGAIGIPLALTFSEWTMALLGWGSIITNLKHKQLGERLERP